MSVEIHPLNPSETREAIQALARAFVTNPLHIAVFGPDTLPLNEAFFRVGLPVMRGQKLVAMEGARVLGFVHWVKAPGCRFTGGQKLRMMPGMIAALGLAPAFRVKSWLREWERLHPVEPHLHLGPIGVSPEAQGRRIGHEMMTLFCREADRSSTLGYLETDREANVAFYERFGFETFHASPVLGIPNFYMKRAPQREKRPGTW